MNISVSALKNSSSKFTSEGVDAETAAQVADVLIYADLRGVSSHGVMRVEHYITRLKAGGITKTLIFSRKEAQITFFLRVIMALGMSFVRKRWMKPLKLLRNMAHVQRLFKRAVIVGHSAIFLNKPRVKI